MKAGAPVRGSFDVTLWKSKVASSHGRDARLVTGVADLAERLEVLLAC